ncbi:MAG: HPr family phosphocarrier protein [Gammaproteobacteria bacterium]|nr:HPr family phosphocarrier protein [Gammaproteobacteria bacterium]
MSRRVEIINRLGLHARAAAKLATLAARFDAQIHVRHGERTVNAKSIMGLMMLAAVPGTRLDIIAEGGDEQQAIDEIAKLVAARFGEAA